MSELRLEHLLEDLRDDGVKDSSGVFTLDAAKAEEKLRDFSLRDPYDYVLKLIQFAIAGKASQVVLQALASGMQLDFDGESVDGSELNGLMGYLLANTERHQYRRWRHLAAGLRAALAVKPRYFSYECWNGQSGFRRSWQGEWTHQSFEPTESCQPYHRFLLKRTLGQTLSQAGSDLLETLLPGADEPTPEEAAVGERCRFLPARMEIGGDALGDPVFGKLKYPGYDPENDPNPGENRPPPYVSQQGLVEGLVDAQHHLVECCLPAEEGRPASLPVPPSQASLRTGLRPGEEGPCRAWLAVAAHLETPNRVIYVEDGVVLSEEEHQLGCPGMIAVISAESLAKDLTGFQLVKNADYERNLEWLRQQASQLRQQLRESLALFPTRDLVQRRLLETGG